MFVVVRYNWYSYIVYACMVLYCDYMVHSREYDYIYILLRCLTMLYMYAMVYGLYMACIVCLMVYSVNVLVNRFGA
nr:MAG TPA: hypothetical protein [Caudoviricetes sp.]